MQSDPCAQCYRNSPYLSNEDIQLDWGYCFECVELLAAKESTERLGRQLALDEVAQQNADHQLTLNDLDIALHDLDIAELQLDAEKVAHATTKGQLVAAKVVTATTITENVKLFGDIVEETNVAYRPIITPSQHHAALKRIGQLWQAKLDTPEGLELEILAMMVCAYEEREWPVPSPTEEELNKFLEEHGVL